MGIVGRKITCEQVLENMVELLQSWYLLVFCMKHVDRSIWPLFDRSEKGRKIAALGRQRVVPKQCTNQGPETTLCCRKTLPNSRIEVQI
jgi:hypothetical protein